MFNFGPIENYFIECVGLVSSCLHVKFLSNGQFYLEYLNDDMNNSVVILNYFYICIHIWIQFKFFNYCANITKLTNYIPYSILHCKYVLIITRQTFKYVKCSLKISGYITFSATEFSH